MGIYNLGGGGGAPELQAKEATPLITNAQQIILPDDGYDGLSKVTVNPMPTGVLKTPTANSIGYVSSGVQTAGYFDTSATSGLQLSTQSARTITPTTYSQTAVASGKYTTGAVTVAGDANLVSSNIVAGKSIFGVTGTAQYPMLVDTTVENHPLSTSITIPLSSAVKNLTYITAFVISCGAGNRYASRSDIFASFYSILPVSGYINKIIGHPALDNTIKSGGIGGVGATSINPANIENIDIYINSNSSNITISNIRLGTGQTGGQTLYIGGDYVSVSLIGYSGEAIPYTT